MCCNLFSSKDSKKIVPLEEEQPSIGSIKLSDGHFIPQLGFGTWLSKAGEVGLAVKQALQNGYTHIDCAKIYRNEAEIGQSCKEYLESENAKSRKNIFITSKLWVKDFGSVRETCMESLKDLQVDYLDLYLIHMPWEVDSTIDYGIPTDGVGLIGYNEERIKETWSEMEKLKDEGLVKSIGVSNFSVMKLQKLLDSQPKHIPVINQVESHPYLPCQKMFDFCKKNGILMTAYSPLANPGRPKFFQNDNEPYLLGDDVISAIAHKHNSTNGLVLLAWGLQRGNCVISKSTNERRIKENMKCLRLKLDQQDMKDISSITTRFRYSQNPWAVPEGGKPEDLWDGDFLG